jgi:hypothetical protein
VDHVSNAALEASPRLGLDARFQDSVAAPRHVSLHLPGPQDGPPGPTGIAARLDLDLTVWPSTKPVSRASRHVVTAAANDEQVITNYAVSDAVRVEEFQDLRVVVLMDLDTSAGFHAIASSGEQSSPR